MPQYEVVETPISTQIIKRTDEDGKVWWIPIDPANSDYQRYLNPEAEHFTPSV
jgi:expansin (peptidoglycan-binding protein)